MCFTVSYATYLLPMPDACCAAWLNISCRCQQMSHQTLRLIMLSRIANTSCCVTTEKVLEPPEPAPLTSVISSVVLNQWQRYLEPAYFLYLFSPKSQDRQKFFKTVLNIFKTEDRCWISPNIVIFLWFYHMAAKYGVSWWRRTPPSKSFLYL